ncbi:hypothetical protein DNTS_010911 [Danionella cerebrum]|uniref:Uncharacterized protein n=1 Tax=Danionella cerebrum TaxID=2873325 RepID=A0A553PEA5_9TELE|nr:hypothetical protein DNTS_010911 [Danionella translucida]
MLRRKRSVSFGGFGWYVAHVERHHLSDVWKYLSARCPECLRCPLVVISGCQHVCVRVDKSTISALRTR